MDNKNNGTNLTDLIEANHYESAIEICPGCENHCTVKVFKFQNGNNFYSGNNCEKVYGQKRLTTNGQAAYKGVNMFAEKYKLLFGTATEAPLANEASVGCIGIPRALGIYENYPFWRTLFAACGIKTVLSKPSTNALYESGARSIMADNICFPAKLMHGHVLDLVAKKVDRIFYPYVVFERKEDEKSSNSFNCPIVAGYSDVLKSSINTAENHNIPFDSPVITFNDSELMYRSCTAYLQTLGISKNSAKRAIALAKQAQDDYLSTLTKRANEVLMQAEKEQRMVILLAGRPYHTDPLIEHKVAQSIAEMGIDVITENVATQAGADVYGELQAVSQWAYPNRIFKAAHFVATHSGNLHFVELTSFGCGPDAFILDEVNAILRRRGKNLTILKIDDVNNIGSLRLRLRSLVESVNMNAEDASAPVEKPKRTPIFTTADHDRTLLAPYFAEGYSEFLPTLFKVAGYNLVNLPSGNQEAAETGLKFANNDVCYPATITIGTIMQALQSGQYDLNKTAVIMTQTGGQCRATNYLALLKNAMTDSGITNVPVLSLALGKGLNNNQPGFEIPWRKMAKITLYTMLYADCLNKLYFASAVREKQKGQASRLRQKYTEKSLPFIAQRACSELITLMEQAAVEFSETIVPDKNVPKIGIVGEIYVKYNGFSNKFVVNWLMEQGIEVASPALYNFFTQTLVNSHINRRENIKKESTPLWLTDGIYRYIRSVARRFDAACKPFVHYTPFSDIFADERMASNIVNTAANFGEGWLIPAEISNLAAHGVQNIISLQPFGCIANHVISKGIEKRVKQLYPQMSLLFLDFDSSTSDANVFNRLHFMVENCKKQMSL